MTTALITGISGQDGSYLAEFLLSKGYSVVGTTRDGSADHLRLRHIRERIQVVELDLLSQDAIELVLRSYNPDEVYNLAARASSRDLWTQPVSSGDLNGLAVLRLLDAISRINPNIRFVQASSSEIFGNTTETPQSEMTRFQPRNPYGVAKAYGHWTTTIYREHRSLFACCGVLYNHESPRRGLEFVTRKISRAAAMISLGREKELRLGRLDARRDWGFAGDFVRAMWLMLQQSQPDDYIVSTGETHSVREFCELAFERVGLDYRKFVIAGVDDSRPAEAGLLAGNSAKARNVLGWSPSVSFPCLVRMMVESDLAASDERRIQPIQTSTAAERERFADEDHGHLPSREEHT